MGLRERKKAKIRQLIQREALRLFAAQGYEATTIDQIAEAAEISPSTFFRYFPNKEAVVIQDDYDPVILAAFRAAPAGLSLADALRHAITQVFRQIYAADYEPLLQRTQLQFQIPTLLAQGLASQLGTAERIAEVAAERTGRPADDLELHVFASAAVGALLPALTRWIASDGRLDLPSLVDECLGLFASGFGAFRSGSGGSRDTPET